MKNKLIRLLLVVYVASFINTVNAGIADPGWPTPPNGNEGYFIEYSGDN